MRHFLRQYGLLLWLLGTGLAGLSQPTVGAGTSLTTTPPDDDEYETYRKKGDVFFKSGRYGEARQQYLNCLEVPGYASNAYAKGRIELSTTCLTLIQQADEATQTQNDSLLVSSLEAVLRLNPADGAVVSRLIDQFELTGNQAFAADNLPDARQRYERALAYTQQNGDRVRQNTLQTQLKAVDARVEQLETQRDLLSLTTTTTTPDRRRRNLTVPVLKLTAGVVAVGAGYYGYTLYRAYVQHTNEWKRLNAELDANGNGTLDRPDNLLAYKEAVRQGEAAYARQGLYRVCLGVVAAAILGETYLFLHKRKPRPTGFSWQPSTTAYGVQICYRF